MAEKAVCQARRIGVLATLRTTLEQANAILDQLKTMVGPEGSVQTTVQSMNDAARKFADLAQRLNGAVTENEPA